MARTRAADVGIYVSAVNDVLHPVEVIRQTGSVYEYTAEYVDYLNNQILDVSVFMEISNVRYNYGLARTEYEYDFVVRNSSDDSIIYSVFDRSASMLSATKFSADILDWAPFIDDDVIRGSSARDSITTTGRFGMDVVYGGGGNDYIFGNNQFRVYGEDGDDVLVASVGVADTKRSWLDGGSGDDILFATSRYNQKYGLDLTGGSGADAFIIRASGIYSSGYESIVVKDFSRSDGDKLFLSPYDTQGRLTPKKYENDTLSIQVDWADRDFIFSENLIDKYNALREMAFNLLSDIGNDYAETLGLTEFMISFNELSFRSIDLTGALQGRASTFVAYADTAIAKIQSLIDNVPNAQLVHALLSGGIGDLGDGVSIVLSDRNAGSGIILPQAFTIMFEDRSVLEFDIPGLRPLNQLDATAPARSSLSFTDVPSHTNAFYSEYIGGDIHIWGDIFLKNKGYNPAIILQDTTYSEFNFSADVVYAGYTGRQGASNNHASNPATYVFIDKDFSWSYIDEDFLGIEIINLSAPVIADINHSTAPLAGGLGDDRLIGDNQYDKIYGLAGDDIIDGEGAFDIIYGGDGDDTLYPGSPSDYEIDYPILSQSIASIPDRDFLYGGNGDDVIYGAPLEKFQNGEYTKLPIAYGGPGDDTYVLDIGVDRLSIVERADEGSDTAIYYNISATRPLAANVEHLHVYGDQSRYAAEGNDLDNVIISFFDPANPAASAPQQLKGHGGHDLLLGSLAPDHLFGGDGDDFLDGNYGPDIMEGGSGDDIYSIDDSADQAIENPDAGQDYVEAWVSYQLADNLEDLALVDGETTALLGYGNSLANQIWGNEFDNALEGRDGDDVLDGAVGDDVLNGGAGADTMFGGLGDDTYYVNSLSDLVIEQADAGRDTVYTTVALTLPEHVEVLRLLGDASINISGRENADILWANDANNVLKGFGGNDALYGLGGDDVLVGQDGHDRLEGGAGVDQLSGGAGADRVFGGDGADKIWGGDDSDIIIGGNGNDFIRGGDGNDNIFADDGADIVHADDGADIVRGHAGDDQLFGGDGADRLIGGVGEDLIDGGLGADRMWGGGGGDVYHVDNLGDVIKEYGSAGGIDVAIVSVDGYRAAYHLERVELDIAGGGTLSGSFFNDNLIGGHGDDLLKGYTGHDEISGGAGDDILLGHAGYDVLTGGAGNDILRGGSGRDSYYGGEGADRFLMEAGGNLARIYDFEIGLDLLDLRDFGLTDFEAFSALASTRSSGYTLIELGGIDQILLFGVRADDLSTSDILL